MPVLKLWTKNYPLARLIFAVLLSTSAFAESNSETATEGFYPIWEGTGQVEAHEQAVIGTTGAHYGILDKAQVGFYPVQFMYRTPNVYAKFRVASPAPSENLRIQNAFQISSFYLMSQASRAFFSTMYTSRLDNPDFSVLLTPISLLSTWSYSNWLDLHHTATYMRISSSNGSLEKTGYFGYSAVAEFKAKQHHSMLLHAGEVGFWDHDFSTLGTSYRYQGSLIEFRLGYFYRLRAEGSQAGPNVGLGFKL